jgi:tripartite ATP-independent transporter DctM subunit
MVPAGPAQRGRLGEKMIDGQIVAGDVGCGGVAKSIENAIRVGMETITSVIVVVEICILLIGVVSRYFFHNPTVWSDEVASALFLWLCMLGAVLAFQRNEHMRLSTVVGWLRPAWQERATTFGSVMVLVFTGALLPYAVEYAVDEWEILTPALEMHNSFRAAALPVGLGLLLLLAGLRLVESADWRSLVVTVGVVVTISAVLWFARPLWQAMGIYNLLIFFVLLVAVCVVAGVPIAISFGAATIAYLLVTTRVPLSLVVSRMDEGMSSLILLAVPLFVFLGLLIEMTGLARAMIDFLASLLGHVRGGLSYVLIGAIFLVSGISGAKIADMAAVAPALFPEMERRGSKRGDLIALLAGAGAMSDTIPPSLFLITLGSVCGVSIAALFNGGLIPALFLAGCLCAVVWVKSRRDVIIDVKRHTGPEIARLFIVALPALALPFLIRFAVVEGIATATEVSTLGIAYTIVVGLVVYRGSDWSRMRPALVETAALSGAILLIIGAATGMAWCLSQSGMSKMLVTAVAGLPGGPTAFLAASVVAFVLLGSLLEGIPAIVLFGPLLFPVSRALGINDIHYAMVIIVSMGLGLFAPPFGVGFYGACAVGKGSPDSAMGAIWIYLAALALGVVVITAVPELSTVFLK